MFRGDSAELREVLRRALGSARDLDQPRAGSEHLLLALAQDGSSAGILARHGATPAKIRNAVAAAGPSGAGAAADRALLAALGLGPDGRGLDELGLEDPGRDGLGLEGRGRDGLGPDGRGLNGLGADGLGLDGRGLDGLGLDGLGLEGLVSAAWLDRPAGRQPVFPLGARRSRQRCARMSPRLGLDAQAVWAASLRLALARRERQHRPEHLALALITLDPGAAWILARIDASRTALAADLADAFPPPRRQLLLRADRRLGQRARARDLIHRYQRLTGRTATDSPAITALISS